MEFKIINTRLETLSEKDTALWGKMNVSEMLAHLNDAVKIALGMKTCEVKATFYSRYIMFPMAVYVLYSWPKGADTAPEMQMEKLGSKPKDFYTELGTLIKLLETLEERESNKLHPHPIFGKLNKSEWIALLKKHIDHHLKQFGK
jgi:hypothetical protein